MATTSATTSYQARLTIKEAFERLKQSITPEDTRRFQTTTLQDVHDAAVVVEDKFAASRSLRNLRRIEPFLTSLGRYAKVIEVLCNGTDYLPWIWAPIKLMLQLSSDYISSLEKLLDAYAQICDTLPRFDRLSTTFESDVNFQKVLAMFYADILDFHRRAYKFFTQRAWKRFFDTSWTGFGRRFKGILESLARTAELVDKEATATEIAEAKMWRDQQRHNVSLFEKERLASQVASVLSWLELGNCLKQDDELERQLGYYHSGTCDWIFCHNTFKRWADGNSPQQLLWLHGKPGAGKSVLCSYIIHELQKKHGQVLYFFSSYRSSNNCVHALRSITVQTLSANPGLAPYIYDQFVCRVLTPSVRNLRMLLPHLVSSFQSANIILDGIDESPPEEQKAIIGEIIFLVKKCSEVSHCKAIISSRDIPTISKGLSKTAQISLSHEQQAMDFAIETFVDRKLNELRDNLDEFQLGKDLAALMKQKIVDRANGMFLWVYLVITSLENMYNIQDLQQAVDMLPSGLSEIYTRILRGMRDRLEEHDFERALRILEWVTFSQRPLRKVELLDGIALHRGNTALNTSSKLLEKVIDTCKPLIEPGLNETVVLVHFSLKEYLHRTGNPITISPYKAHFDIALACTVMMEKALDVLDVSLPAELSILDAGNGLLNLLPYAHKHWLEHLLCVASDIGTFSRQDPSTAQLFDLLSALTVKHDRLLDVYQEIRHRAANPEADKFLAEEPRLQSITSDSSFYPLVCRSILFRRLVKSENFDGGSKLRKFELYTDPTLMSHLIQKYEEIIRFLLSAEQFPGLPDAVLSDFKRIHLQTAFHCRFAACNNVLNGFETAEKRGHHEKIMHMRRLPCLHSDCAYSTLGFTSTSALNRHLKEYHPDLERPQIPHFVRRSAPSQTAGSSPHDGLLSQHQNHSTETMNQVPQISSDPDMQRESFSSELNLRLPIPTSLPARSMDSVTSPYDTYLLRPPERVERVFVPMDFAGRMTKQDVHETAYVYGPDAVGDPEHSLLLLSSNQVWGMAPEEF